jgi:hypothetical protein
MTANLLTPVKEEKKRELMSAIALTTSKKIAFTTICCALLMFIAAPAWAAQNDLGLCSGALPVPNPNGPNATGCGFVITVTEIGEGGAATKFFVTNTGNGNPYDSLEDVLVGIQNNSGGTLASITLTTPNVGENAFLFDGDGPCALRSQGHPECSLGGSGYEGPNNTFSGITGNGTTGTVNFTVGIPNGQGTWFALENAIPSTPIQSGGDPQPVTAGGTNTFSAGGMTQAITFPNGTNANGESITDAMVFLDCETLNATLATSPTPNAFSGGSRVPAGAKFTSVPATGTQCPLILNQCSDSTGPLATCGGINANGSLIKLKSLYTSNASFKNPALVIASDTNFDWANISNLGGTSFDPGDPCLNPPCGTGGGSKGLNGREAIIDLNLPCQILTYHLDNSNPTRGTTINLIGNLVGCPFVDGEQKVFGQRFATLLVRLTGPLNPPGCSSGSQTIKSPPIPLVLPFNSNVNIPFKLPLKIPASSCIAPFKISTAISSGTVNYFAFVSLTVH